MAQGDHLKIIAISGTNGSGKDTLGHILANHHGYQFISVTELLRAECNNRGIPSSRENLRTVSAEWRRQYGLGVLVDKAVDEFSKSKGKYSGLAIASLRNPGEVEAVHKLGGKVVWLDAEPEVRFKRIKAGSDSRSHRGHEDNKTFEQFIDEEEAEMHSNGDAATLNMSAVKNKSDVYIDNSHEDAEQFRLQAEKVLGF